MEPQFPLLKMLLDSYLTEEGFVDLLFFYGQVDLIVLINMDCVTVVYATPTKLPQECLTSLKTLPINTNLCV